MNEAGGRSARGRRWLIAVVAVAVVLLVGAVLALVSPSSTKTVTPTTAFRATPRTTVVPAPCVGTAMTTGQPDIESHPTGTTFCLSGVHNWTLHPKDFDRLIGPAVLDGGGSNPVALVGDRGVGVVISNLVVRNYAPTDQQGAIGGGGSWTLKDVQSHDNGTVGATKVAGGFGASLGAGERVIGGRYYNNRQGGLQGGGATNAVVDGVEIDHNNFTDDTYATQNIDCNYEAGGMKWVAVGVTVKNSQVHDNACRGLWTDIGAHDTVIANNQIYNNWDEGIFIEISGRTTITGNTIVSNGFHTQLRELDAHALLNGCTHYHGLGSGILIGTSGITTRTQGTIEIASNRLDGNCNGLFGFDVARTDAGICVPGPPICELAHLRIHDNTIVGSTDPRALNDVGFHADDDDDLGTHDIVFGPGNDLSGVHNCQFSC